MAGVPWFASSSAATASHGFVLPFILKSEVPAHAGAAASETVNERATTARQISTRCSAAKAATGEIPFGRYTAASIRLRCFCGSTDAASNRPADLNLAKNCGPTSKRDPVDRAMGDRDGDGYVNTAAKLSGSGEPGWKIPTTPSFHHDARLRVPRSRSQKYRATFMRRAPAGVYRGSSRTCQEANRLAMRAASLKRSFERDFGSSPRA